jgi:hypothetical protein
MYIEGRIFLDDINMFEGICIKRYLLNSQSSAVLNQILVYLPHKENGNTSIVLCAL